MSTVLVVEDNRPNMKLARDLLAGAGHRVLEATEADTGVRLARDEDPDLIVMDVHLPGTDGLTAVRLLRADPGTREIPIIAMTAYAMRGDESRILDAGCDHYVAKPIRYAEFLAVVERALRGGRE